MIDEADDHAQAERQPRYLDEDTSPTTAQELKGWYAYGIAAEVFAVCGVGTFVLPAAGFSFLPLLPTGERSNGSELMRFFASTSDRFLSTADA